MRRNGWTLVAAIAVLFLATTLMAAPAASPWGANYFPNIALTTQDGKTVHLWDDLLKDKKVIINFIYTECSASCPLETAKLVQVQNILKDRLGKDIFFYSITLDPKRDTPPVVKQYAAAFGPNIIGLTGTADEIAKVAKEYRVYYAEHRTGPGPDDYSMDHSSVLYLMSPNGAFVAPVRADQSGDEMAVSLKKLMG